MKLTDITAWSKETAKIGSISRGKLREILPTLMESVKSIKGLEDKIKDAKARIKKISDNCAIYAKEHPEFMDSCTTAANGVESVKIEIDGITYKCALGYDGYKRIDGDDMDYDFLMNLPKDWVISRLHLSTTGVKQSKPSAEKLENHGLFQVPKYVWSVDIGFAELEDQ